MNAALQLLPPLANKSPLVSTRNNQFARELVAVLLERTANPLLSNANGRVNPPVLQSPLKSANPRERDSAPPDLVANIARTERSSPRSDAVPTPNAKKDAESNALVKTPSLDALVTDVPRFANHPARLNASGKVKKNATPLSRLARLVSLKRTAREQTVVFSPRRELPSQRFAPRDKKFAPHGLSPHLEL